MFIDAIKRRCDVQVFFMTEHNREKLTGKIAGRVRSLLTPAERAG